jgi:phosphoglycolate phosphatase
MNAQQSEHRDPVSVLITDLDNTLWDWFELWYNAFKPFFDALVAQLRIPESRLKAQIKAVHQKHGTSEYSLLLQELPCVREKFPNKFDPYQDFGAAIQAYRDGRRHGSKLYPGVLETLTAIRRKGTHIVGFTESQFFYTTQRIRVLGLDGVIDVLYTTQDQGLPPIDDIRRLRNKPDEYYDLHDTKSKRLPSNAKKPDRALLDLILSDQGAKPGQAIYVGDNLYKDVLMAKQAGVRAVHAAYGEAHNDPRYELLRDVTHWTPPDVAREKSAKQDGIKPNYVIASFADLLNIFEFGPLITNKLS